MIDRLSLALWRLLPAVAARGSRWLGGILADGRYLTAWPRAAAGVPLLALASGLGCGIIQPGMPLGGSIFASSLYVLIPALTLGAVSAHAGFVFAAGFGAADLVFGHHLHEYLPWWNNFIIMLGYLISYAVMATLCAAVPASAQWLRSYVALPRCSADARVLLDAAWTAALAAALTYLALAAAPMLIRPAFVWYDGIPVISAVYWLQHGAWLWSLMVAVLTAVRVLFEYAAAHRDPAWTLHDPVSDRPSLLERASAPVAVTLRAALATAYFAGLLQTYSQALLLFGGLLLIGRWELALTGKGRRPPWIERIPPLVRLSLVLATAILPFYIAAPQLLGELSFTIFLLLLLGSAFVAATLFPRRHPAGGHP